MQTPLSAAQGHHPPHRAHWHDPIYAIPPPEEAPPSYDDAIHASTSALLVGPPPDYSAFRAYTDPDESSSEASSEADDNEQYMPEHLGQVLTVFMLLGILYLFWRTISQPDPDDSLHGYA